MARHPEALPIVAALAAALVGGLFLWRERNRRRLAKLDPHLTSRFAQLEADKKAGRL